MTHKFSTKTFLNFFFILISLIYIIKIENSTCMCLEFTSCSQETDIEQTLDSDFYGSFQIKFSILPGSQNSDLSFIQLGNNFLNGLRHLYPPAPIVHNNFNLSLLQSITPVQQMLCILKKSHTFHRASDDASAYEIC